MMYIRFPLSLRNVEDLLHERGIDIGHETVRFWWNRFGPMFACEIRERRAERLRSGPQWRWHLDEVFVKINCEQHHMWRGVDHEGEVLESFVTKRRDKKAALNFLKKTMRRYGRPASIVTDLLRSYGAALREIGAADLQETGRWFNNRPRTRTCRFDDGNGRYSGSGGYEVCRCSFPSTTISTNNATSTQDSISSSTVKPLSPNGANLARHKGQGYCPT